MTTYTTTNQKTVWVMRGGVMTRCDDSRTHGGDGFTSYGAANEATKNRENKTDRGLRGPLDDEFNTTTNQNHAGTTDGDTYWTRNLTGT